MEGAKATADPAAANAVARDKSFMVISVDAVKVDSRDKMAPIAGVAVAAVVIPLREKERRQGLAVFFHHVRTVLGLSAKKRRCAVRRANAKHVGFYGDSVDKLNSDAAISERRTDGCDV